MGDTLIATGTNIHEVYSTGVVEDLPAGTKYDIVLKAPWGVPLGVYADMLGAEWVFQQFGVQADSTLLDVEGTAYNEVTMHLEANGTPVVAIIACLVLIVLAIAGMAYIVNRVDILAALGHGGVSGIVMWGVIGVLGFMGLKFLTEREKVRRA